MKSFVPLLFLLATRVLGADAEFPIDPSDDFSPGLGIFALAAICIIFVLVGVGIVVAAVVVASVAVLTGLGIVSSAVLVGILRRRFSSGLRTFHYLACAFIALPAGVGALWLGSWLSHSELSPGEVLTIGSIAGMGGGLALAFLFDRLAGAVYRRFATPVISASTPKL